MTVHLGNAVAVATAAIGYRDGLVTEGELGRLVRAAKTNDGVCELAVLPNVMVDLVAQRLDEILADREWCVAIYRAQREGTPYDSVDLGLDWRTLIARAGVSAAMSPNRD